MFRNGAKTAVLLAALGGVMIGVGSLFGRGGAIIGSMLGMAIAASLIQMAISRSREFEADRVGADITGAGEPLARALEKLDAYAARVPMDIAPAQASHFIVNPLTGRNAGFANLFRTHPPMQNRVARLRGHHV